MQIIKDRCYVCGSEEGFIIHENTTLLREARCKKCDAILRTSDLAKIMVKELLKKDKSLIEAKEDMNKLKILNSCSVGHIHEYLKDLDGYICFEFYDDIKQGQYKDNILCDNFENLTFKDETFDVVISEDVLEHVVNADKAFKEIERILKKGGHHFFTVPLHENKKTEKREGKKTIYHGDPIREQGALVITDWGYDISKYIENDNVEVKENIVHRFHEMNDITDVDKTYEEYKTTDSLSYYKYNSIVFDCIKQGLEYTGERYIPNETSNEMTIEHMQRYQFAKEFVKNKVILDAACGEGYGSHLLNEEASKVYSLDLDEKAVNEAQKKYKEDNIQFYVSSIEKLPFNDKMFDVIVSFETIEHVTEEIQMSFLKEVSRTLKEDGIFIVSTPNKYIYTDKVGVNNPYHKKEFYKNEFLEFLSKFFKRTYVFNQYFRLGYFIDQEGKGSVLKLNPIDAEDSRYYIVICSNSDLQIDISKSYEVFENNMYFELIKNCNKLDKEMIEVNKDFKEFRYSSKEYIKHLEVDIKVLQEELINRNQDLIQLNSVIEHRDKDIEELKSVINHRDRDIEELKLAIGHRDKDIKELRLIINDIRNHNMNLIEKIEHPLMNAMEKIYKKFKR